MNSPNKSATISVTDFLFLHHFFKHLLSQTRVQSMKKGLRRKSYLRHSPFFIDWRLRLLEININISTSVGICPIHCCSIKRDWRKNRLTMVAITTSENKGVDVTLARFPSCGIVILDSLLMQK